MKKIQSILVIALGVCVMLTSCQELDTPINNIPTIETGEATEITATSALLSFKSENGKADCSLVYILSTSPDMNDVWESESNYIKDLIPNTTYYYMAALRSTTDGKNNEVRGEVKSFTTLSSIRLISVTSTSWDGSQEEYNPDMLGTYLFYTASPSIYQGHGNMYVEKNVIDGKIGWKLPQEIFPASTNLKMCAYFPYQKGNSEEYMIPFGTYKYDEDVLWGTSDTLNEQTPDASIQMQHTMARVIFSITGTANVLETTIITDFMLANRNEASGIPTYGYLNIYTGNFENFTYELPITRSTNFHPTDVAKDIEVLMFPAEFSNEAALLTLKTENGHELSVNLPQARWEAGHQYTYPITYDEAHITIGNVVVEDWNNNKGGDITIND